MPSTAPSIHATFGAFAHWRRRSICSCAESRWTSVVEPSVAAHRHAATLSALRVCVIVPVYDHHAALPRLVDALRSTRLPCWLIDDGSHEPCARAVRDLCADNPQWMHQLRLEVNQGKGAAVLSGMRAALAAGF